VVFANRARGTGTRALLDHLLHAAGLSPGRVTGYEREYATHLAVAAAVADGDADVGLGIEAAAAAFRLGFVPFVDEPYELVVPLPITRAEVTALLAAVNDDGFRRLVSAMGGYDTTTTGKEHVVE
jgi:putative molybdopterin biosynthesis protein